MINPKRVKALCHPEVFKRIPVNNITELQIQYDRIIESSLMQIMSPRGGRTTVKAIIQNDSFEGTANCSMSDNFCKKTGRELAFKRMIREYWNSNSGGII